MFTLVHTREHSLCKHLCITDNSLAKPLQGGVSRNLRFLLRKKKDDESPRPSSFVLKRNPLLMGRFFAICSSGETHTLSDKPHDSTQSLVRSQCMLGPSNGRSQRTTVGRRTYGSRVIPGSWAPIQMTAIKKENLVVRAVYQEKGA